MSSSVKVKIVFVIYSLAVLVAGLLVFLPLQNRNQLLAAVGLGILLLTGFLFVVLINLESRQSEYLKGIHEYLKKMDLKDTISSLLGIPDGESETVVTLRDVLQGTDHGIVLDQINEKLDILVTLSERAAQEVHISQPTGQDESVESLRAVLMETDHSAALDQINTKLETLITISEQAKQDVNKWIPAVQTDTVESLRDILKANDQSIALNQINGKLDTLIAISRVTEETRKWEGIRTPVKLLISEPEGLRIGIDRDEPVLSGKGPVHNSRYPSGIGHLHGNDITGTVNSGESSVNGATRRYRPEIYTGQVSDQRVQSRIEDSVPRRRRNSVTGGDVPHRKRIR